MLEDYGGAKSRIDFCKWAGISKTPFYAEVAAGRLKVVRVGRKTLIRNQDAEAWLNNLASACEPATRAERRAKALAGNKRLRETRTASRLSA